MHKTPKFANRIIALFLIMCIFLSNSNVLLKTAVMSIAADGTETAEIVLNQEIIKYIPYSYSEEDQGVILQQSISITNPSIDQTQESKISITLPTYATIVPETIEIVTKSEKLTQDESKGIYYKQEEGTLTIFQKNQLNEKYYITYYYSSEAYDKYLETTHVNEYPEGELIKVEKNEETGEVWAYIDFAWDSEENEGEMPNNKHLVDKTKIKINAQYEIITELGTATKANELEQEVDIAIGNVIENTKNVSIEKISKGLLYTSQAINYETENEININKSDVFTNIKIEDLGSTFVSKDNTISTANIQYNSITISKKDIENIINQDGRINILDAQAQVIQEITLNTEVNEEGNYVFTYPEGINKITIEISGIANNGFLTIKQNRTIAAEQEYLQNQMAKFKAIRMSENIELKGNNEITQEMEQIVEILLEETKTSVNLNINNTNLSTVYENTGVEFTVELKNNNEHSDIWEDPFIIIQMPKEVEDITINSKNLLYGEGITLHSASVIDLNGAKAIKLQLLGKQQNYVSDKILGGTTIIVNANITLKELTPTSNDNEIRVYYHNSNKTNYEHTTSIKLEEQNYEVGLNTAVINYIAPIGFKTIHKISEFDEENTIVNSENSEKEVGKISILEPEKEVKQTITLMNNTGNETINVNVLGRIPFIGNTDIVSNEDLQTTVNTMLCKEIEYKGEEDKDIIIYYSENGNADIDLKNAENGWTTELQNLTNIKSYMIVITTISQGEKLFFEYSLKIPAMLEHNENLYSALVTYYTNNTEAGQVEEISKANTIGLTTGIGARAQIELSAGIDTGTVFSEGQKVKYSIKVTNTGELPAKDVVIKNPIPAGTKYIEETIVENEIETFNKYTYYSSSNELQWEIGELCEKQTAELEYTLVIDNIPTILEYYGLHEGFMEEDGAYYIVSISETGEEIITQITDVPQITISNKAILQSSNIEKEIVSNEIKNDVKKSYFEIIEESSIDKANYIEEGQEYEYYVIVENKTDLQMENLQITKVIPDGVTYKSATVLTGIGNIHYADGTINIIADKFEAYGAIEISIKVSANSLPEGVYKKEVMTNTQVKANGIEQNTSSSISNMIGKPSIIATLECEEKQRYVYEKDILNYTIKITNQNDVTASNLLITNIIPEGTKLVLGSYTKNGNEYSIISDGTRNVTVETNLKQETMIIKIQVQIENLEAEDEEVAIINKAIMKSNTIPEMLIGEIKHTVINTGNTDGGNSGESGDGNSGTSGGNTGNSGGQDGTGDNGSGDNSGNSGTGGGTTGGETGEDGVKRYKIKGSVWNDKNKDGQRQDDEDIINGIKVYLINEKGEIIKDYKTGEEKIATTDIDGEYQFKNIEKGKYIIIFMYDNTIYDITEYQKNGIVNDRNSDAILKTIVFEGNEKQVGVTDIIEVLDSNLYSIDLGLNQKAKFNMMLEAGINKITIQTNKETKQIPYDMANLAKVEIRASQLNEATIIVEYNLKITNKGDLAGSASQIIASKGSGVVFTSSANKAWYEGNDNNLYLTELSDIILQPGESTISKLILVKQMTTSNTGTIENNFAITKTYNDKGIQETTLEDNIDKTTLIVVTSTGTTIAYTGMSIAVLGILTIVIDIIRRKLTEEKRWI